MDVKFTMVISEDIARKMSYIGKYYGRSRIKEIDGPVKSISQSLSRKLAK